MLPTRTIFGKRIQQGRANQPRKSSTTQRQEGKQQVWRCRGSVNWVVGKCRSLPDFSRDTQAMEGEISHRYEKQDEDSGDKVRMNVD